jgi:hypothetical protein
MAHASRLLATLAIGVLIAACSSSPAPSTPVASASPSAVPPSAPSPSATASPSTPAVSAPPTQAPPTASDSPEPAPPLSAAEKSLVDQIRADSHVNCVPRRTDLPPNAVAGVECHIGTALVDRIGVYSFSTKPAIDAYFARLATAKVTPGSGDCATGTAGDHSWPAYLPDEGDAAGGLSEERSGCYLDESGIANVRLTCYGNLYLGVLGKTADIKALYAWTWKIQAGDDTHRDPPGLCAAPD